MTRNRPTDWKTFAGFAGLLFLVVLIGLIGIRQIEILSRVVTRLAQVDIPLHNAVLQMQSSNSKYGMAVRSYMFWRGTGYLEAAAQAGKINMVRSALEDFDRQAAFFEVRAPQKQQKEWIAKLRFSQKEVRALGDQIIVLTDRMTALPSSAQKPASDEINRSLMSFESKLFQQDAFLADPVQAFNLKEIDRQLAAAEAGRRQSVVFLFWSLVIGLLLGGQTALLIWRRSRREQESRELLWRRVIRIEEAERNNLSLQIHDQMGQDLSALKIYLGLIEHDLPQTQSEQRERIEKTKSILDTLMAKAHNISEMLRPPELDDLGLVESIAALVLHYKEMTGLNTHYIRPSDGLPVSAEASLVLYRIIQEALTNIAKHSGARNVEVSLQKAGTDVCLLVTDDGSGFDYKHYAQSVGRRKEDKLKLGLLGLRERVEVLGGLFQIETHPGRGTKLKVLLPCG